MTENIRSRKLVAERLWDWAFLNECFAGPKIRCSDVDGIVEKGGRVLFIEAKPTGAAIETGQRLLHDALRRRKIHVLVLWGDGPYSAPTVTAWAREGLPKAPATNADVQGWVARWFVSACKARK